MRQAKATKQFCRVLTGLQGNIALFALGQDDLLLSYGYPSVRKELEAVRLGLEDLGLFAALDDAITRSEALAHQGRYDDAEMLILEANRELMKASGAEDDMRRMYKAANDSN